MANALQTFEQYRPLLFSIAYRMLGSVMEAEDIVQEAYLRYQSLPADELRAPKQFLCTVVTRLSLNQLSRARETRESYIGPWLPEPLLTDKDPKVSPPGRLIEQETISMAFLVLLERLTPEERAVFLLREVFEYPYDEIANMLEKSEGACRQALHRARVHIAASRPRFSPSPRQHSKIFKAFVGAIGNGDLQQLESLLAEDVGLVADGGGRIRGAAIHPLHGRGDVSRFLIGSLRFAPEGVTPEVEEVNGQPAIVLRSQGQAFIVVMLELDDEKINVVRLFGNPQKLSAL